MSLRQWAEAAEAGLWRSPPRPVVQTCGPCVAVPEGAHPAL